MGQAIVHLIDNYVSKGFGDEPQVKFQPGKNNPKFGIVRFKVSNRRFAGEGENKYDNYSIELRGIPADSKLIEFLSTPGTRVSLYGELAQEEYKDKPYQKVTCEGRNSVIISRFGDQEQTQATRKETVSSEEL